MILAMLAAATLPQPQDDPLPSPELARAGQAWSECLGPAVDSAPADGSPEEAAQAVLASCAPLQTAMMEEHRRWVDGLTIPEARKRDARDAMRRSLVAMEAQLVRAIRASRAD